MSKSRRGRLGAGALMIAIPVSAAAIAAGQALASPAPDPPRIDPPSHHVSYGHDVIVTGNAPSMVVGHTVVLEFARRGSDSWSELGSTTIAGSGAFRIAARLEHSGRVRVLDTSSGSLTPFVAGHGTRGETTASISEPVDVGTRMRVPSRGMDVLGGQAVRLRGRLLPGVKGRKVSLQARQGGSWRTLATARTGSAGRFVLRYLTGGAGQEQLRVGFAGDRLNGRSTAPAGLITAYREAGASWYYDAGNTACGFHALHGVANRTLPCGTKVALRYNGRSVTATVDDRGPFVAGRDWDLNQNTAAALAFGGVGAVWSSQ
jgi:hypothetical protein